MRKREEEKQSTSSRAYCESFMEERKERERETECEMKCGLTGSALYATCIHAALKELVRL